MDGPSKYGRSVWPFFFVCLFCFFCFVLFLFLVTKMTLKKHANFKKQTNKQKIFFAEKCWENILPYFSKICSKNLRFWLGEKKKKADFTRFGKIKKKRKEKKNLPAFFFCFVLFCFVCSWPKGTLCTHYTQNARFGGVIIRKGRQIWHFYGSFSAVTSGPFDSFRKCTIPPPHYGSKEYHENKRQHKFSTE